MNVKELVVSAGWIDDVFIQICYVRFSSDQTVQFIYIVEHCVRVDVYGKVRKDTIR